MFIFSDILELNREILIEGNSLFITLSKSLTDEENRFKRINVKKITSIKKLLDTPINTVKFNLKSANNIHELSTKLTNENGNSNVEIELINEDKKLMFKLKNKRQIDRKSLNTIKNKDISTIIN